MSTSRAESEIAYAGSEFYTFESSEQESRQLFEEERYNQEYHQQEKYAMSQFQTGTDLYSRLHTSSSGQTNEHVAAARNEIYRSQEAFGEVGKRTQQKKIKHKGNTSAAKKEKKHALENLK